MENLIYQDKLEDLLVSKWTHFMDVRKLMAFVMSNVRDVQLPHVDVDEVKPSGVQISISYLHWTQDGFVIWADFSVPIETNQKAVGTTEMTVTPDGKIVNVKTIGNLFVAQTTSSRLTSTPS